MTIPTYAGLGTALSGLEAMQAGIDTTSENLANASNPDYAEEQVNLTDDPSLFIGQGGLGVGGYDLGTGVNVQSISRQDDIFLDQQYWGANAGASYDSTVAGQLSDVQSDISSSSTDTLQSALGQFYSAWNSLSSDQSDPSATGAVLSTGNTLAAEINQLSAQISTTQSQASSQLATLTGSSGEISVYANQIASLNQQIEGATAAGMSANDLEDSRNAAIDKLSALVNVTVTPASNGADGITLGDGTQLVNPTTNQVTLPAGWSATPPTYSSSLGGTAGALVALAATTPNASDPSATPLATMSQQLTSFANQLSSDVNTASGTTFFAVTANADGTPNVAVSATSAQVQAAAPSASAVYATETDATQGYAGFIGDVGSAVQQASNLTSTSQSVLTAVSNQRQSVSGVSLNEEMSNLITYQQGYEASARVMNTMQSVIQTLISSVGGAGL